MTTSTTPEATETTIAEQTAIELRKKGATQIQIRAATGLTERQVKEIVKGTPKPKRTRSPISRAESPFSKSIERALPLAIRTQGIRDHELRNILHKEYGSTWSTSKGRYESKYTADHLKRVKEKVHEQAHELGCSAFFLPDWIDEGNPRVSNEFLISAATDLMSRVDEYVNEYMVFHGTSQDADGQEGGFGRRKQCYAVRQYLLKLAFRDYGPEPIEKLLHRTATLVDALEGTPDVTVTNGTHHKGDRVSKKPTEYYPEPSRLDAFLDFVEAKGWIKA
ncbi:hypothetical protein [Pseudomonas sp. 5P_5.1_Bac1]|uniref:hypothetical protein n=1 Tax=Pseudomonas sp. 5P_5.1_Bac1 TaxID=2971616 RepID=UPI0021C84A0B|nr:hypothetical protein [Pseudomonas sp. 5P_5.1_Bac1]MCU1722957.1 hypothetical protein [Pseudomonas sp. 5P_5.1_Bac1]